MVRLGYLAFLFSLLSITSQPSAGAQGTLHTPLEDGVSGGSTQQNYERGLLNAYTITNVPIVTHDNLSLDARLYDPKISRFPGKRPALIFTNSWTLSEYEYEVQARRFAAKGYIVLAYSSRGFGGSEGYVSVAGPNDIRDFSTVVDWLQVNTRTDPQRIGMAGISYGAGLSLLAAAFEPRIKVVASMSGWGNLEQSLYRNDTVQKTWLDLLISSGKTSGQLDPDIFEQVKALEERTDPAATSAWAALRSPETYVDRINERRVPVFLENSYLDALFPPLQIRPFYDKLEGPKRMMMDEGLHASAAIPGILGLPSRVWNEVHDWMDHYLLDDRIPIRMGVSFQDRFQTDYYESFPELSSQTFSMRASDQSMTDNEIDGRPVVTIQGNIDSGAISGIPLLSDAVDAYTSIPVIKDISRIDRRYAFLFETAPLTRDIKVQGAARIGFTLMPHTTPVTLVAYLYDESVWGVGSLVAFSVTSLQEPSLVPADLQLDLNVTSFRAQRGHRLTLAIDTVDSLFMPATLERYKVSLATDTSVTLELPLVAP
jgi:predicted acyl esterase